MKSFSVAHLRCYSSYTSYSTLTLTYHYWGKLLYRRGPSLSEHMFPVPMHHCCLTVPNRSRPSFSTTNGLISPPIVCQVDNATTPVGPTVQQHTWLGGNTMHTSSYEACKRVQIMQVRLNPPSWPKQRGRTRYYCPTVSGTTVSVQSLQDFYLRLIRSSGIPGSDPFVWPAPARIMSLLLTDLVWYIAGFIGGNVA